MIYEIVSPGGDTILIDYSDLSLVVEYRWHVSKVLNCRYAMASHKGRTLYMHRLIMAAPSGVEVDHISGDGLDNRRCNLRFATRSQNCRNRRATKRFSGFRGVSYLPKRKSPWQAQIWLPRGGEKKTLTLGYFKTPEEAAHAYDQKANELFGEFVKLNFPMKETPCLEEYLREPSSARR